MIISPEPLWLFMFLVILGGYLLGSLPTAYLIAKTKNVDIRKKGSGNVGATNTFRTLGRFFGFLVFFIDALKGFLAVFIVTVVFSKTEENVALLSMIGGAFSAIGHIFPVWLRFKGGKGVATLCGILIALSPWLFLCAAIIFFTVLFLFKMVSLSSITAVGALPFCFFIFYKLPEDLSLFLFFCILAALIIFMHRSNIQRILQGSESRIGDFLQKGS